MKKIQNLVFLSFVLGQSFSLLLSTSPSALASTPASDCVLGVLSGYEVREHLASVCRNVRTEEESRSVQSCVKALLYRTGSNPNPLTYRTDISEDTAIDVCSIKRSSRPGRIIVAPPGSVIQQSNQQFANCINKQMFREREVCIDPWGRVEDDCFFDKRRETITESTGITFEQASTMCGG